MRNKGIYVFLLGVIVVIVLKSCQSEEQINYARYFVGGRDLYIQHCQNCHSAKGEGLGDLIPPLTDTAFLSKNRNRIACMIKYGMDDAIVINGKPYEEKMPAEPNLTNMEIAQIVTYITNSFGNKQGIYNVDSALNDINVCIGE